MNGVKLVTISKKEPLFTKDFQEASSIEWLHFEENGLNVVAQKGLYNVGDKGVYILPDFCLPDSEFFSSFVKPNGEYKSSKLGKINGIPTRVRAIPFNMSLSNETFEKVYSLGILFTVNEVEGYFNIKVTEHTDLEGVLGVEKYSEPDTSQGENGGEWPTNFYKTDEINIASEPSLFNVNERYYITRKVDGSSITIMKSDKYPNGFISSRRQVQKVYNEDGSLVENCGSFVTYGYPILEKLLKSEYNNISIRGELNGSGFKGSGNKNNPDTKLEPNVVVYSIDKVNPVSNKADVLPFSDLVKITSDLGINKVDVIKADVCFASYKELISVCNDIFNDYKSKGVLIEGVVVRSMDSKISFKVMNSEYDSKK